MVVGQGDYYGSEENVNHIILFILSVLLAVTLTHELPVKVQVLIAVVIFCGVEGIVFFVRYQIASWHDRQYIYHGDARRKWLGNKGN